PAAPGAARRSASRRTGGGTPPRAAGSRRRPPAPGGWGPQEGSWLAPRRGGGRLRQGQQIEQTGREPQPAGIDVDVVGGGAQVVVAEDPLQRDDIDAGLQQVGGVAGPGGVW